MAPLLPSLFGGANLRAWSRSMRIQRSKFALPRSAPGVICCSGQAYREIRGARQRWPDRARCRNAEDLIPRGLLHSSVVAFLVVQKFALGVPHNRLEQHIKDQEVELDRGTICRYTDEAGGALGDTIVHAMWQHAISNACVISTDATSGLVQPEKSKNGLRQACEKEAISTLPSSTANQCSSRTPKSIPKIS